MSCGKSKCKCKVRCCCNTKIIPSKAYTHLIYSSTSPQIVRAPPTPMRRDVIEFNQSPITKAVTHPVDGDLSKFKVNIGGIYSCSWLLNTVAIAGSTYYLSQGTFVLQINGVVLPERPQHSAAYTLTPGSQNNVFRPQFVGQDMLRLNAGDILQLRYIGSFPDPNIPDSGLNLVLTQNFFSPANPVTATFNCAGADLILERVDA